MLYICRVYNYPALIQTCINKLLSFNELKYSQILKLNIQPTFEDLLSFKLTISAYSRGFF